MIVINFYSNVPMNRLSDIMEKLQLSDRELSKISSVDRSTIYRIRKNKFHKITKRVRKSICKSLCIQEVELLKMVPYEYKYNELLLLNEFNKQNLDSLSLILELETGMKFIMNPYNGLRSLNIRSKYKRRNNFSGNFRINIDGSNPVIEIVDFDFDFFDPCLYLNVTNALEKYSSYLGSKYIFFYMNVRFNSFRDANKPIYTLLDSGYRFVKSEYSDFVYPPLENVLVSNGIHVMGMSKLI